MHFVLEAVNWLEPLTYAVGAVVGISAFCRCRKIGYLVVTLYFFVCIFSLLILPHIKAELYARRPPTHSEETQRKIDAAVAEALERVMQEEGAQPGAMVAIFGFLPVPSCSFLEFGC